MTSASAAQARRCQVWPRAARSVALVLAAACWLAGGGARAAVAPAAAHRCVAAEEARAADDDEGAPPKLSTRFSMRTFTVDVSADGLGEDGLPISIEDVCDVPKALERQATQLAGIDGLALITDRTSVWQDGRRLVGADAATALDGADTATLRVRLAARQRWGADEDGDPVPTFDARRVTITD